MYRKIIEIIIMDTSNKLYKKMLVKFCDIAIKEKPELENGLKISACKQQCSIVIKTNNVLQSNKGANVLIYDF